jgi:hypothetical protein
MPSFRSRSNGAHRNGLIEVAEEAKTLRLGRLLRGRKRTTYSARKVNRLAQEVRGHRA